jgi:hypothetical protein
MRTFWFVAGTAAGVYVSARARRAAEAMTVDGIHDQLSGWFAGAAVLREELLAGMHEKEHELRDRLHLGATVATPALTAGPGSGAGHVASVRRLPTAAEATGAAGARDDAI